MCRYCEPLRKGDRCFRNVLPPSDFSPDFPKLCIEKTNRVEWFLMVAEYPRPTAGPINFCPMCGRKLGGEER